MSFKLTRIDLHKPTAKWYSDYLESDKWKAFRTKLQTERSAACETCGEPSHVLHHKTYARLFNELPEDVVFLCKECHKATHDIHDIPYLFLIYEPSTQLVKCTLKMTKIAPKVLKPKRRN